MALDSLVQADSDTFARLADEGKAPGNLGAGDDLLEAVEALEKTGQNVAGLGQRKLLADANTGTAVEGEVLPANLAALPAVRVEFTSILSPDVGTAVEEMCVVEHSLALLDVDGAFAIGATAAGQACVAGGVAGVHRQRWEETENLGHDTLEVGARLEVGKGQVAGVLVVAKSLNDVASEAAELFGVTGKHHHGPGEERGSGVTAGKKNVEKLGTQLNGILGLGSYGVEEDVVLALDRVSVGVKLLLAGLAKSALDALVDKSVDLLAAVFELGAVVEKLETGGAHTLREVPLAAIKVGAKVGGAAREVLVGVGVFERKELGIAGLAKEQFSGGVEGETEEDGLDVDFGPALFVGWGHDFEGILDVDLFEAEIADLVAGELGAEHGAGVRPGRAISRKLVIMLILYRLSMG